MAYKNNRRYSRRSCANRRPGRRVGLFIGGALYGLIKGIFFDNKY